MEQFKQDQKKIMSLTVNLFLKQGAIVVHLKGRTSQDI